jgi:16S rRNA processing protein RimM
VQLQRGSDRLGEYAIENLQKGHDSLFVKFRSVNDREEAERLRGAQIMLAREEFLQRAPGQFFYFEIIGLPVYSDTGQTLGEIVDILRYPANDVWVIRDGGEEKLIPAIDAVIQKVDLQNRRVIIVPIPGLLEDGQ